MHKEKKKISLKVIRRLPRYYRYLQLLLSNDVTRISSKQMGASMGLTPSQIRQDFNCFGGFGQQGYGYNVAELYQAMGEILGTQEHFRAIVIGAGNMGQALVNYPKFQNRGYTICGVFDVSPQLIGKTINHLKVLSIDQLESYIAQEKPDIAILTIPHKETKPITDRLVNAGIQAIWNFSAGNLQIDEKHVVVENVHLSDSLMVLGFRLKQLHDSQGKA